jgi:secondary thiamine-phosphate synthase enzyme
MERVMWLQKTISITRKSRGFHLITDELLGAIPELTTCNVGILHLFIQHTSASLCINENADSSVRRDLERYLLKAVPDVGAGDFEYEHDYEGKDDMPAHIKSALLGSSLSIPIQNGRLALGTWQGVYLGEHRISAGSRTIVATLHADR